MKVIFTILVFVSSLTSFSQTDKVPGDYKRTLETKDNDAFEYQLTVFQDGTFFFHYYSKLIHGTPSEVNKYGKGKWVVENNLISFFTEKEKDLDEKNTLDFTNSKARFITKSTRDKTDRIVETKLIFLESEIFWMKKMEMLKIL
jgi:hypothetical protein